MENALRANPRVVSVAIYSDKRQQDAMRHADTRSTKNEKAIDGYLCRTELVGDPADFGLHNDYHDHAGNFGSSG